MSSTLVAGGTPSTAPTSDIRMLISPVLTSISGDQRAFVERLVEEVVVPTAAPSPGQADYRDSVIAKKVTFKDDDVTVGFSIDPNARFEPGLEAEHRAAAEKMLAAYNEAAKRALEELGLHVSGDAEHGFTFSSNQLADITNEIKIASTGSNKSAAVDGFWRNRDRTVGRHSGRLITGDVMHQTGIFPPQ